MSESLNRNEQHVCSRSSFWESQSVYMWKFVLVPEISIYLSVERKLTNVQVYFSRQELI